MKQGPRTSEFGATVCCRTGTLAVNGICPEHEGDACLIGLPDFYEEAQRNKKALYRLRQAVWELLSVAEDDGRAV